MLSHIKNGTQNFTLICFMVVEHYYPNRVKRQFGYRQEGPPRRNPKNYDSTLRTINEQRYSPNNSWFQRHYNFIKEWNDLHKIIDNDREPIKSTADYLPSAAYVEWFKRNGFSSFWPDGKYPHPRF